MAAGSVAAFWAVALLLIIVPGADWAFVLGASLRARSVVPAVGGLVLGYAGITIVVAAGVGAIVGRSPALLTALTVAGGCYLMWHGATTLARPVAAEAPAGTAASAGMAAPASPATAAAARTAAPPATGRAVLVRGMGVSALNPKGLLVFLALLPQFTSPRWSWPLAAQLGLLGLVFVVSCGAFYLGLGSAARKVLASRPAVARAVTRVSGAAMVVIGALLLVRH
jgi:threonine/homoserine/homoserine lactone efflux protein